MAGKKADDLKSSEYFTVLQSWDITSQKLDTIPLKGRSQKTWKQLIHSKCLLSKWISLFLGDSLSWRSVTELYIEITSHCNIWSHIWRKSAETAVSYFEARLLIVKYSFIPFTNLYLQSFIIQAKNKYSMKHLSMEQYFQRPYSAQP